MDEDKKMRKFTVFVDMDGVLTDFDARISLPRINDIPPEMLEKGFFRNLPPMSGALDGMARLLLKEYLDVYIATKYTWRNRNCATEKFDWINQYFPWLNKKIFLISDKTKLIGDLLIDDDTRWEGFSGRFFHFDKTRPEAEWKRVLEFLETLLHGQ